MSVGQDLLNVPFPEMVYKLGLAIAQSQHNLDKESIEILKIMGDKEQAPVSIPNFQIDSTNGGLVTSSDADGNTSYVSTEIKTSMIGAGFQPTFYQFAETIIEVKMAITMSRESTYERTTKGTQTRWWRTSRGICVRSTPIDAKYSSTYNYNIEGSSLLRTRLVPVPPNTFIQKILEMRGQALQMEMEVNLKKVEMAIAEEQGKKNDEIDTPG